MASSSPTPQGTPRWPRYVLAAALLASLCAYVPRYIIEPCHRGGKDLAVYYAAAKVMLVGGDVYDPKTVRDEGRRWGADVDREGYRYPPFTAWAMRPFAWANIRAAQCAWVVFSQVCLLLSIGLLCVTVFPSRAERKLGAAVLALIALNSEPLRVHLLAGQMNLLMLLFTCAALWSCQRGRPGLAGAALGVAASIKCYPITLVAYFGWKRQWRLVAAAAGAMAVCAGLAIAASGWEPSRRFLVDMLPMVAVHPSDVAHPANQSIYACFVRLFTINPYVDPVINSPIRAKLAAWTCSGVLICITVLLCKPRSRDIHLEASLVVIATTLVLALAWDATFVVMLLPIAVALRELMGMEQPQRSRWAAVCVVAVALIHARFPWWSAANGDVRTILLLCPRLVGSLALYTFLARRLQLRRPVGPRASGSGLA